MSLNIASQARELVEAGIAKDGSNLCGMAALIDWIEPESKEERQPTPPGQALYNWESLAKQCDRLYNHSSCLKFWEWYVISHQF